jgi:hypothetical protein
MAVLKLITQAAIKAAKPAFKKYIKSNKLPFNDTNFGKYLQSKGYESPFREGSEKLKTKVWNKMKAENIPGRTTAETGLLGGEKGVDPVTGKIIRAHSEASKKKFSQAQKNQIDIGLKTKNPDTGEMGYHANPTIQNIIDFINSGGKSQSLGTFAKLQQNFAKQFGKGDLAKLRKPQNKELYADFNEAFNKRRMEAQLIKQGLLDELTPANELLTKYGRQGWENVLDERQALTNLVFDESKIGQYLLDLGYDRNQIVASIGHDYPLEQFAALLAGKGRPNITPFRSTRLVTKPENIHSELGFMNQAKARGIEPFLYEKPLWYADDLNIINKIMKDAQLTSKFYGPTGTRQQIGMGGEIDPKQLLEYLKYIHADKPFGSAKFPRTLPTRDDILAFIHGKKKWKFKRGGLVSLGSRILRKLAKKLSRQELKMMMGN